MKYYFKKSLLLLIISLICFNENYTQQACYNTNWTIAPPDNNIGIHTGTILPEKPLHIHGVPNDCADPAIRLSYADQPNPIGAYICLLTPGTAAGYSQAYGASSGDLLLQTDEYSNDIILSTKNSTGAIRFATTPSLPGPDIERMTIIPVGHVGIFETDPREVLQLGSKLTFHIGANNDFIGYNEYVDDQGQRRFINSGFTSCLNFCNNGSLFLGVAGDGLVDELTSYEETGGGFKGITLSNVNDKGHIGIGTYGWEHNRLTLRGMGNTDATNSVRVMNSDMATSFIIRDDNCVGIGNTDPKDLLHIGQEITFHDGGTKSLRFNAYYDPVAGYSKNITGAKPSVQFGISGVGGDNSAVIFIDRKDLAEEQLFQGYDQNGGMKGIKILHDGNMGICEINPTSRLVVRGSGNNASSSSLEVKNSQSASLFFVRDDGNVGIGFSSPGQKLAVNGKVRIGTNEVSSTSDYYNEYMLSVDGTVIAEKVVVSTSEWADKVFTQDYNLMTIEDLEKYIDINGKLPEIPNEVDVKEKGIDLAKINTLLLRKIEELTLYIIELKNENQEIKNEIRNIKE